MGYQLFYNNMKIAGINNINVFKGDSAIILMNMIQYIYQ